MSGSRALAFAERTVRAWVAWYTRALPGPVREGRRGELDSDLWEHAREGRAAGAPDLLIAAEVLERMLAGVPSDLSWRRTHLSAARRAAADGKERPMLEALKRNWWQVLAGVLATWNAFLVSAYARDVLADDVRADEVGAVQIVIPAAAVALLVGGLLVRRRSRSLGAVAVSIGAVVGYVSAWWFVPLVAVSLTVVAGALADAAADRRRAATA
jgi:hypothetical protein